MDAKLLEYYNRELVFMREKAAIFAENHPKIAKRLGMQDIHVADPYVERLIEAFCFMSARTQIKLDAEFPQFTQRLLEVIAPHYLCPVPAISVAQFHPATQQGDLSHGITIPKHSKLRSKIPYGEQTACEFRTGQDTTLWPVRIKDITVTDPAPYLQDACRPVKQAIRIRLQTVNNLLFSDIKGLSSLSVYLCGEESIATRLFEYIHTAVTATVVTTADHPLKTVITQQPVVHDSIHPDQHLLPANGQTSHHHLLLQEYFACPSRFLFFTLNNLTQGLSQIRHHEADIILLCDKEADTLIPHIDASQCALYCSPVINLFSRHIDRIEMDKKQHQFHLVADRTRPLDYEVYSVSSVRAQRPESTETLSFRPLFHTLHQDQGNWGKYFSVRRETRLASASAAQLGSRSSYMGTEVFLSLVDQQEAPFPEHIRYLSVEALLTNRDLPSLLPRNGKDDLTATEAFPVASIGLIRPPSKTKAAPAEQQQAWQLIQLLSFHYQTLMNMDDQQRAHMLQQLLSLYVDAHQQDLQQQIQSVHRVTMDAVTRRLPGQGPLLFVRGIHYDIHLDETPFSGNSPYLFVFLLSQWLSHQSAINSFAETAFHTYQRGFIHQWPVMLASNGSQR